MARCYRIWVSTLLVTAIGWAGCAYYGGGYHRKIDPSEIVRLSAGKTRLLLQTGKAYLVCAFDDERTFRTMALEGAISLPRFRRLHPKFPSDRLVIFYCNESGEGRAAARAAEYRNQGHKNVVVLENGVSGWKFAGFPVEDPVNL